MGLWLRGGGVAAPSDAVGASGSQAAGEGGIIEEISWWNAMRGLAAAAADLASSKHHGTVSRDKLGWLDEHLKQAARPSMICLMEVTGGGEPFQHLRACFKSRGYESKRLPAESRGALNGAAVA